MVKQTWFFFVYYINHVLIIHHTSPVLFTAIFTHYSDVTMSTMASQITSLDCLLNPLFRRRLKKTSKFRVTGLCEGNPLVTGGFPLQRGSGKYINFEFLEIHIKNCKPLEWGPPITPMIWRHLIWFAGGINKTNVLILMKQNDQKNRHTFFP